MQRPARAQSDRKSKAPSRTDESFLGAKGDPVEGRRDVPDDQPRPGPKPH